MTINKDPLYSIGNFSQYSVITYMGKESGKEWIYFAIHLKLTQHCKLTIINVLKQYVVLLHVF